MREGYQDATEQISICVDGSSRVRPLEHRSGQAVFVALLSIVTSVVVLQEKVLPEVAIVVAPHRVDVVGVVLCIVEFDEEVWCLNPIVVRVTVVDTSRPSEMNIPTGLVHLCDSAFRQLARHIVSIFFNECHQCIELQGAHFGS